MAKQIANDHCPTCGQELPENLKPAFAEMAEQQFLEAVAGRSARKARRRGRYMQSNGLTLESDGAFWHVTSEPEGD
jgi:hypothetical protein